MRIFATAVDGGAHIMNASDVVVASHHVMRMGGVVGLLVVLAITVGLVVWMIRKAGRDL